MALLAGPAAAQPEEPAPEQPAEPADSGTEEPAPQPEEKPVATTGTISGVVLATDLEAPLAGATVTIVGSELTATTDDEGTFLLEVEPGTYKVRAEVAGFEVKELEITVKAGETVTADFGLVTVPVINETVVIVGSRTPRTNIDSTVPVDVITAEEMSRTGRTQTSRILHKLAPSYVSTPQTIADGSDHIDPASLRGLGPDQVLVLVNGKRRHRTALMHVNGTFGRGTVSTDLNSIAVGSIKRIEILRDGAAAQYGSDAIAGVINIVTKDATDVIDVTSQTGITASRDGAQLLASANYGFKLGSKGGFVNITGEYLEKQATNRAGIYTGPVYTGDRTTDDAMLDASNRTREDFGMRIGEAASIGGIGAYNMELPIGDTATFYSFGDVAHRRGSSAGFYRFPVQVSQNVPEFYANGFLPEIHPVINDTAVTIGIRRKGKWTIDASLTHGANEFKFNIENSVNASLGTASPTTFDAGTLLFEQTVADLDLVRTIETDKVKSLALVLGSELRVERYRIEAGDLASYTNGGATFGTPPEPKVPGAQVFPGFQPSNEVDRTRDNIGVYGGVETELNKRIAIDSGVRFESYSDFGRSLIGKIAARAKILDPVSLRAAVNTGFRAPSLQQLWFSNVSTLFLPDELGNLQPTQVLTSNNQSPVTRAFGIPKLREERATNLSGGVSIRPTDNFSLAIDGYFIRLKDRIVLTSQFTNANPIVADILAPFPGVSQAQFFANAVDTDTGGIDVIVDYSVDVGDGQLTVSGGANVGYTVVKSVNIPASLERKFAAGDPEQLRTFFFGRQAENRIEDSVPWQKGTLAIRYALEGLSALVRANYYGPVRFQPDLAANDEYFGAKVLFDVDLGYQATKEINISVGADNLFDTYPDRQKKEANINAGRFLYSRNVSQFGQNGGFYYAKLELTFF